MKKVYVVGEKDGQKYVGHMSPRFAAELDNHREICKEEYLRYRQAGTPSWGEQQSMDAKSIARDPSRALHWADRKARSTKKTENM